MPKKLFILIQKMHCVDSKSVYLLKNLQLANIENHILVLQISHDINFLYPQLGKSYCIFKQWLIFQNNLKVQ